MVKFSFLVVGIATTVGVIIAPPAASFAPSCPSVTAVAGKSVSLSKKKSSGGSTSALYFNLFGDADKKKKKRQAEEEEEEARRLAALEAEQAKKKSGGMLGAIGNFFAELDAFVDDATMRRLGSGSNYYGKRKSSFYGAKDASKKRNRDEFDPTEDYMGPSKSGYFQWIMDDEGRVKPVTRMKGKTLERRNISREEKEE